MIQWNRTKLDGPGDLFQMLQQHSPDDVVTIIVLREGRQVELLVTLKAGRPRPDG
jgi:S1-C subfamily serine protease